MGKSKSIDSSLLDKAILFASKAHHNVERRGKGFPYIAHPLEAMSIVATITNDQELLAAACLHDVIEDTEITYEEIKKEFGQRVADIVLAESDEVIPNLNANDSWIERKKIALDHLANASRDVQIVAIGDKLSNIRAMYRDYKEIGEELWNRFHVNDPALHEWRYRELINAFNKIRDTEPYKEFCHLVNKTFANNYGVFKVENREGIIYPKGSINYENALKMKDFLDNDKENVIDFSEVYNINFSGIRGLIYLKNNYPLFIKNVSEKVAHRIDVTGATNFLAILREAKPFNKEHMKESGDGYTAVSYFTNDDDAMVKLYYEFVASDEVEREKRYATSAMLLGIPTPLCGDMLDVDGKKGVMFERIQNKVSIARALSNDLSRLDELAKMFAELSLELHSTKSKQDVFPNVKEVYKGYVDNFKDITLEEKNKIKSFIDSTLDTGTCLHGDFHMGNVIITDDGQKLWIDMSDFAYGDPRFDLGTLYFVTHNEGDGHSERLFHCSNEVLKEFYNHFVKYYYKDKSLEEIDEMLKPFAALTVIHFASKTTQKPWMSFYVKELLLEKIK